MARSHIRRAGVNLLEVAHPRPVRTIRIVRARDKYVTPAVRVFIEQLRELYPG
jgi:DNA-binding transcriptional LysR family regulator